VQSSRYSANDILICADDTDISDYHARTLVGSLIAESCNCEWLRVNGELKKDRHYASDFYTGQVAFQEGDSMFCRRGER
jgi:hypothetical protein